VSFGHAVAAPWALAGALGCATTESVAWIFRAGLTLRGNVDREAADRIETRQRTRQGRRAAALGTHVRTNKNEPGAGAPSWRRHTIRRMSRAPRRHPRVNRDYSGLPELIIRDRSGEVVERMRVWIAGSPQAGMSVGRFTLEQVEEIDGSYYATARPRSTTV